MRYSLIFILLCTTGLITHCSKQRGNVNYKNNPEPLVQNVYIKLPLGSVKPSGWLRSQMEAQATGLTGNLDQFWPDLVNSAWHGGSGDHGERGPYYLDGLVPLAFLLNQDSLIKQVKKWIEPILASCNTRTGWYGPARNKDRWPLAIANKVLMQYYEATGDLRAIEVLTNYFKYLHDSPPDWSGLEWRGIRAMENALTGYWLYRHTGEKWILETIEVIKKNSPDWVFYYESFPWDSDALADMKIPFNGSLEGKTAHGVNNAMAIKYPGLWYLQSNDERMKSVVFKGIDKYDLNHGQVGGRFSGDEHLSGKSPVSGTELCTVVEYMFSLEELYAIFGEISLVDRLEMLAYNALPGTATADMWSHQYNQQSNQVLVSVDKRNWSSTADDSNIYGLEPNYGCCLANMHQGWPKFVQSMWMATKDNGLALVAYGPSIVKAKVGNGSEVTILEETDYPFKGTVNLTLHTEKPVRFPIDLRIPGWADSVTIKCGNRTTLASGGSTIRLNRKWKNGDRVIVEIPMEIRLERRFNNSISVLRGPLYYSLRIDKEYKRVKMYYDNPGFKGSIDWEIFPRSAWNYGLLVNTSNSLEGLRLIENPVSKYPFADKGDMIWSSDSGRYIVWTVDAPVSITAKGASLPQWTLKNNSAEVPLPGTIESSGDPETITLVPYGCAKLRITEFPVIRDFEGLRKLK